jgi:hypothetical protein
MDLLYQEYSSKLRKSTQELMRDSDEKDKYSALMDARLTAIREQNKVHISFTLQVPPLFLIIS